MNYLTNMEQQQHYGFGITESVVIRLFSISFFCISICLAICLTAFPFA